MGEESRSAPLPSQLSKPLRMSLSLLLELKPSEPYAFLAAYFYHASHRSDLIFEAFSHLSIHSSNVDQNEGSLMRHSEYAIERAFETLLLPSDSHSEQQAGVRLKDYFALSSLFCKGLDSLQGALGRLGSSLIESDERLSFPLFRDLLLIHCLIQDLLMKLKEKLTLQFPQKNLEKRRIVEWIQDWTSSTDETLKCPDMIEKLQKALLNPSALKAPPFEGDWLSMSETVDYISARLDCLLQSF